MSKTDLLYAPSDIRTGNMVPLRSSDIDFKDAISLTKQSDAAACDINNIMAPYARMDMRELLGANPGQYLDLTDAKSYHEAMNTVIEAQDAFDALPAHIRKRFSNDPEEFLEFCNDRNNLDEMVRLGLAEVSVLEDGTTLPVGAAKRPQEAGVAATTVLPQGGNDTSVS